MEELKLQVESCFHLKVESLKKKKKIKHLKYIFRKLEKSVTFLVHLQGIISNKRFQADNIMAY